MADYAALIDDEPQPKKSDNPYLSLVEGEESDSTTRRQQNVLGAVGSNPEQYAMAREIEKHLGIPAPVADRNFPEAERKFKINQMDHVLRSNPELARQMERPEFAKLAHDHAQQVGDILNGAGSLKEIKRSRLEQMGDAFRGGFAKARQSVTIMANQLGLYDGADAEFATRVSEQERIAQRYNAAPDVQAGLERISKAETMGEALLAILEEPAAVLDTTIRSFGASSPSLLAAAGGSVVGPFGTAAGAGLGSFAVEFSNTVGDVLQERGVDFRDPYALSKAFNDPEIMAAAREKATKRGIAIGTFDALTAGMAGKLLAGAKPTMRSIAPRVAGELGVQAAGGMAGEATAQAVTGEYKPGEILMEGFAELPTGIVEVRGNWRHARDAAVRGMLDDYSKASTATKGEVVLNDIINQTAQAPLLERGPDVFAQALNDAASEGMAVSEIHINARQLATVFNQDPIKVAETLGIDAETLDSALASNGDVSVPVGEFVTALAADPTMRPLVEHAKLGVGEMSAAEAREWESKQGDAFRQEAERVLTKRQAETEFSQSAQEVEDFVLAELQKTGRFTESVNKADAALHKAFAVAMGDRLGVKPMDFFKQHMLRVTGETVGGGILNQMRPPTESQFYSNYVQHIDIRGRDGSSTATRDAIMRDGFKKGIGPNALPPHRGGKPLDIMDAKFRPQVGDVVYLAPKGAWKNTPNGSQIQEGWKPAPYEVITITEENKNKSAYELFKEAVEEANQGDQFDQSGKLVTDTPAFRNWFGDSKVVDAEGKPLVVYHGSPDARFMQGDATFKNRWSGSTEGAHWFASDSSTAKTYADDRRAFDYQNAEPDVIPAFLSLRNPLIVEANGAHWRDAQKRGKTSDVIKQAKADGHDGVIIRNVKDDYNNGKGTKPTDTYVVFDSKQIKSATGNNGQFNPNDPNILHQPSVDDFLAMFDEAATIELTDAKMSEEQIDEAERQFLSAFPEGTRYGRDTRLLKRVRRESDAALESLRGDPEVSREVASRLGPFSSYQSVAEILPADSFNPNGSLRIAIFGKEQTDAGLVDEPALTITVTANGELTINGPEPGTDTFAEFKARGWADHAKGANGEVQQGWTALTNPENPGQPLPIKQLLPLLADTHARVREWRGDEYVGLHWTRATGALGGLFSQDESAVFFQPAYHGSPHTFQHFSLEHIGTGEGAQAFGWGLYFAEDRNVAAGYYRALADNPALKQIRLGSMFLRESNGFDYTRRANENTRENIRASLAEDLLINENELHAVGKQGFRDFVLKTLDEKIEDYKNQEPPYDEGVRAGMELRRMLEQPGAVSIDFHPATGGVYSVDIPDEAANRMLLWDSPLSQQPENVQKALLADPIVGPELRAQGQEADDLLAALGVDSSGEGAPNTAIRGEAVYSLVQKAFEKNDAAWQALGKTPNDVTNTQQAVSEYLGKLGIPGLKYWDGNSRTLEEGHMNVVLWDQQTIDVMNASVEKALYQNKDANRGSFNPDTNTIALLQNADLSTFLHESGHYFLEVIADVASQPNAPAQIRQDFDTLLQWFGVPATPEASALDTWAMMSLEEKRQYHEQFARGFEAYLYEGKAPSVELQGLFSRFRAWLINVYKSLTALNVELTDEVRGVMDRMIATDEQIATAEAARRFAPIFQTAEQAGMTAEEWAAYQGEHQQATDDAAAVLESRSIRDMRWLTNAKTKRMKELQKTSAALRSEVEMVVRSEVMSQPVYQAWQFLTGKAEKAKAKPKADPKVLDPTVDSLHVAIAKLGGIDKLEIVQTWGTDPADIKALPRPVFGMPIVRTNDGKSIDEIAQRLGDYGYLPLDEHGKADVRDLEDAFALEMRGTAQYSVQKDYAAEIEPVPHFDLENYPHGKLDRAAVNLFYGTENEIPGHLDALKMLGNEGYAPDAVANEFGFTSGDDMMRQLAAAQAPEVVIEGMTDQRMLENYGDLSSPEAVERAAEAAIHNDVRARFLTRELNALRTATGKATVLLKAARSYAEQRIAGLKVKDAVKSAPHRAAEARSARGAEGAMKAGDIETAAVHKRDQVLNHELARASLNAQTEVQSILQYLKRFDKDSTRKALDADYRDQIDALLEKFDLRKSVSEKVLAKRKSLADWIDKQVEMGIDPVVDQRLINDTRLRHYKDVSLEELRGLKDTVANIEHLGRLKNQLLTAQKNRNLAAAADEIVKSIFENGKGRKPSAEPIGDPQGIAIVARWGKQFAAMHRKFASIARQLDGMKDGGAVWEYFIRSMNDAGNAEADMRAAMSEKLANQFEKIKHVKLTRKEQVLPGVSLTRENMLVMALNWGNEGNRQRLMDGGLNDTVKQLTQPQIESILDRLTKEEWDFVQGVWDMLEENRPLIAAQERRLTGVEPKWVEPAAIQTKHGTYRGGYYPAKYDGNFSTRSNELEAITDLRQQMQGAGNRAQTRKGYTQARAGEVTGRPLKLALSTLTQHVNEVTHRLAWQDWLIDTNRLLKRNDIDSAIREHYGPHLLAEIRDTVRDIAVGDVAASNALERGLNHIRTGATIAGLGWNITTSLLQPLGLTQSMVRIGYGPVGRGLMSFVGSPLKTIEAVEAKSKFMQHRGMTMNREINDVINRIRNDKMSRIEGSFFYMIQAMQKVADMPTWLGRYEQALTAGEDESRAIALADQAVIDAQGAGQLKDLAKIQRGSPALKLFTNFYSYFNTTYNLAVERSKATDYSNPLAVGKLAVDYLMLFSVPAVLGSLLKSSLKGDWEDDEDKLAKKLAKEQLNYLFGTMVLLREVGGAFTGNFGYEGPAGLRVFAALQKLVKQAEQGEVDKDLVKALINVGGVVGVPGVGQFPSGQVNRTIDGVVAVSEGKAGPTAVIFGPPPKN